MTVTWSRRCVTEQKQNRLHTSTRSCWIKPDCQREIYTATWERVWELRKLSVCMYGHGKYASSYIRPCQTIVDKCQQNVDICLQCQQNVDVCLQSVCFIVSVTPTIYGGFSSHRKPSQKNFHRVNSPLKRKSRESLGELYEWCGNSSDNFSSYAEFIVFQVRG